MCLLAKISKVKGGAVVKTQENDTLEPQGPRERESLLAYPNKGSRVLGHRLSTPCGVHGQIPGRRIKPR